MHKYVDVWHSLAKVCMRIIIVLALGFLIGTLSKTPVYAQTNDEFTTRRQIPPKVILLMVSSESETSAYITWMSALDVDGYIVYRSECADEGYEEVKEVDDPLAVSYTDTGLTTGVKYYYRICTYWMKDGKRICGDFSVTLYTDIRLEKPQQLKASSDSYNSVRLSWQKVDTADGYTLYQAEDSEDSKYKEVKQLEGEDNTSCLISELNTGTTYYYKVEAYQKTATDKLLSPRSEIIKVKPMLNEVTVISAEAITYNKANFIWKSVSGAQGYLILRADKKDGTYKGVGRTDKKTLTYTDKKLTTGKNYYYQIVAYRTVDDKEIKGQMGEALTIKTSLNQVEVKEIQNIDYQTIELSWDKVAGATSYVVYRSLQEADEYEKIAQVKAKELSYTDTKLETGVTYYYKVYAQRGEDKKAVYGKASDVVTIQATLSSPVLTSLSLKDNTNISLAFEGVTGAEGYLLEYELSANPDNYIEVLQEIGKDETSYLHESLASKMTYTYRIRAYCEVNGERIYSEYSNELSQKTKSYSKAKVTYGKSMTATEDEIILFTALCRHEAGTSYIGCLAVANAVINRVRSGNYPNSISGVIHQSGQFSGANSGALNRFTKNQNKNCRQAVVDALAGANVIGSRKNFRSTSYFYSSSHLAGIKSALSIGGNTFF